MRSKNFLEKLNKYWTTPAIAIIGSLLALYFTYVKNDLEADAQRIENIALKMESEIMQKEFKNNLKIKMYGEVKEAITQDDEKLQNAVLLLVNEMLADDSIFKEQLITILLASPNIDESVKKNQNTYELKSEEFAIEEKQLNTGKFVIDVFYLEDIINEAKPRAQKIVNALQKELPDNYQIRLRLLPLNINAKSGYRISSNQIRFENDESETANKILTIIENEKIFELEQLQKKIINPKNKTPNYLSVFVRNM